MYQVALCEDEYVSAETEIKICRSVLEKLGIRYELSVFSSSAGFWQAFSEGRRFDFILMDIVMDAPDGITIAGEIRKLDKDVPIVFVTNYPNYALKGYDVNALDYIIKPLEGNPLERLIETDYKNRFFQKYLTFAAGAENVKIPLNDIICIETVGRQTEITTANNVVVYPGKLHEIIKRLPAELFARCHVGYIINLNNIKILNRKEAVAVNGKIIPVSRTYSESVKKAFLKQLR